MTSALVDVAVDVGMLTALPAGQNVHRVASVSIRGIIESMYQLGSALGENSELLYRRLLKEWMRVRNNSKLLLHGGWLYMYLRSVVHP